MPGFYVPTLLPIPFSCPGEPTIIAPLVNTLPFAVLFNGVQPAVVLGLTVTGFPCVATLFTVATFIELSPLVIAGSTLTFITPAGTYTGIAPAGAGIIIT